MYHIHGQFSSSISRGLYSSYKRRYCCASIISLNVSWHLRAHGTVVSHSQKNVSDKHKDVSEPLRKHFFSTTNVALTRQRGNIVVETLLKKHSLYNRINILQHHVCNEDECMTGLKLLYHFVDR